MTKKVLSPMQEEGERRRRRWAGEWFVIKCGIGQWKKNKVGEGKVETKRCVVIGSVGKQVVCYGW